MASVGFSAGGGERTVIDFFPLPVSALPCSAKSVDLFYLNGDDFWVQEPQRLHSQTHPPELMEGEGEDAGRERERLGRWGENLAEV